MAETYRRRECGRCKNQSAHARTLRTFCSRSAKGRLVAMRRWHEHQLAQLLRRCPRDLKERAHVDWLGERGGQPDVVATHRGRVAREFDQGIWGAKGIRADRGSEKV